MQTNILSQTRKIDLIYRVIRLSALGASLLPMRLGYLLADCGGYVIFLFSARRRCIIGNNIRRMEADERRVQQKVCCVFRNSLKNYFDLTKLSQFRFQNLEGTVTIEGWHHLEKAMTEARGTIIASAHLGNFEVAAQVLATRGIKMAIIVEPYDSTSFLRNIAKLRQRNGCRILPVGMGAMKDGLQILRHGGAVVVVCDRDVQGNGVNIKFFGEETSLPSGAVSLALRTGASIVPVFSVRKPDNRFTIYIEPPLRLVDTGNRNDIVKTNMERLAAIMERYIRQYPEQWVVLEPIWRNQEGKFN